MSSGSKIIEAGKEKDMSQEILDTKARKVYGA